VRDRSEVFARLVGWHGTSHEIRVELLRAFCEAIKPQSIISNFATIVIVVALVWNDLPRVPVVIWAAFVLFGGLLVRAYAKRAKTDPDFFVRPTDRAVVFLAIGVFYGAIWGAAPVLFYAEASPYARAVILFFFAFYVIYGPYAAMPGYVVAKIIPPFAGAWIGVYQAGDMTVFTVVVIISIWLFLRTDIVYGYHAILRRQFELQAKLRSQSAELERANAAKSDFLAVMSHEIRTPMNGILGMIYLIERLNPAGKLRDYTAQLKSASDHLAGLLNDILDFSRLEERGMDIEQAPFQLYEVVHGVMEIIKPGADAKDLETACRVAPAAEGVWLGDSGLIRQVLINLLGNAVKFTAAGQVTLQVDTDGADDGLVFTVSDTGKGIEPARQVAIFEPFTQEDASITREHGGTGLGLTISRRIVEALGGEIAIDSEPGRGTTLRVHLPLRRAPMQTLAHPAAGIDMAALPRARVLVVDDSEFNRMVIREVLEGSPCTIEEAVNAGVALDLLAEGGFDAMLTDIRMPGMDGFSLVREVRRREAEAGARAMPIVALTAAAFSEDRDAALAAGCNAYLTKPVPVPELIRTLAEMLGAETDPEPAAADGFDADQRLRHLIPRLYEQVSGDMRRVRAALSEGDVDSLGAVLHAARGHAGLFGLLEIDGRLAEMEAAAENADFEAVERGAERVETFLGQIATDGENGARAASGT